mmetsp:Transcript_1574/g.5104  ORF Transcript_1574/g.5104 Transcript_1574/m.5104 type:complete len:295 (+) Transcript_1574:3005-3889(+)
MAAHLGLTATGPHELDRSHAQRRVRLGLTAPGATRRLGHVVAGGVVPVFYGLITWRQLELASEQLPVLPAAERHAVRAVGPPVLDFNLAVEARRDQRLVEADVSRLGVLEKSAALQRGLRMVLARAAHDLRAPLGDRVRLSDWRVAWDAAEVPTPLKLLGAALCTERVPLVRAAARKVHLFALRVSTSALHQEACLGMARAADGEGPSDARARLARLTFRHERGARVAARCRAVRAPQLVQKTNPMLRPATARGTLGDGIRGAEDVEAHSGARGCDDEAVLQGDEPVAWLCADE